MWSMKIRSTLEGMIGGLDYGKDLQHAQYFPTSSWSLRHPQACLLPVLQTPAGQNLKRP